MMKLVSFLMFSLLYICCSGQVPAQSKRYSNPNANETDNLRLITLQTNYINKLYYQIIATPKDIINGKECLPYSFRSNTTPFYYSRDKLNASLDVNNRQYKNIKLQYDTFLDELIYTDTSRIVNFEFPRIALNKDIIEGFHLNINGNIVNFRHFRFPESPGRNLQDGFYEVVYEGPTQFIIKHHSTLYNKEGLNEYKYSTERYVLKGDKSYRIKTRKSLLPVFKDQSEVINEFLHKSKIKVKKAGKEQIVAVLKYYDSLKASDTLPK